jgi:hypothetical protein
VDSRDLSLSDETVSLWRQQVEYLAKKRHPPNIFSSLKLQVITLLHIDVPAKCEFLGRYSCAGRALAFFVLWMLFRVLPAAVDARVRTEKDA